MYRNIMYPCSECSRNGEMEDKYKRKEQVKESLVKKGKYNYGYG